MEHQDYLFGAGISSIIVSKISPSSGVCLVGSESYEQVLFTAEA